MRPRGHVLLVVGVASALACRRPTPPTAAKPPMPALRVYEATLQNGVLSIRVQLPLWPRGRKPVVIATPADAAALLAAGVGVATYRVRWDLLAAERPPPPPNAEGRTAGLWLLASPTRETVGQSFFVVIETSARLVRSVVDYLATLPEVDSSRLAIMGTSTQGFTVLEAIALEPRLRAAIVFAACGDYLDFLHRSSLAMKGEPLELDPGYEAELRSREAVSHPERLTHTALLMVHGANDIAVPTSCARRTAEVLGAAYERAGVPERFQFVLVEGAGHTDLRKAVAAETQAWLRQWLVDGGAR